GGSGRVGAGARRGVVPAGPAGGRGDGRVVARRRAAAGPGGGRGAERRARCGAGLYDGDDGDVPPCGQGDLGPVAVRAPIRLRAGGRRRRGDRGPRCPRGVRGRRAGPVRGPGGTGSAAARAAAAADGAAMSEPGGRPGARWCWALRPVAVLAHIPLAVLAVAEFAAMGWPLPTWFDTGAVILVLATAAAGLAASTAVAVRAAAGSRALRALIRAARRPVPTFLRDARARLG